MAFDALISSTSLVAVAEIGDKTQLLSFMLAARYRKAWPIIAGILVATLLNHAMAAWVGHWIGNMFEASWVKLAISLSFVVIGLWTLIPDKADELEEDVGSWGAFWASAGLFFVAEMGDKTQLATVALGAQYDAITMVVIGTTLGMLIANIPAVLVGEKLLQRMPLDRIRQIAAALFVGFGLWGVAQYFMA